MTTTDHMPNKMAARFLALAFVACGLLSVPVLSLNALPAQADTAGAASAALYPIPAPSKNWLIARFVSADAQDDDSKADIRPLLRFMQTYYMQPAPAEIPVFLHLTDKTGLLEQHPDAFALFSGFICRLATLNPEYIAGWFTGDGKTPAYGPKTMAMLQYAIWRAGHLNDPEIAKFFTEKPVCLSTTPGTLASSAVRTPDDVDMMWGGFLATGDTFYIEKLIGALNPATAAPDMSQSAHDLLAATAAATLKANALDHDIVLRALEKQLETATDDNRRKQIDALLPQTTPGRQFATHDGNFGAQLVAAPLDDIMTQVTKPADAALRFPVKASALPGEKIGFLIVYSGMGLTDDLTANVDFDMSMTAPDGTVEQGSTLTRKTAFAGRLPSRFGILHTPSFLGVEFTPDDAPGVYTLNATLHDNVGHHDMPLHAQITLQAHEGQTQTQTQTPAQAQTSARESVTPAEKAVTPEKAPSAAYRNLNN